MFPNVQYKCHTMVTFMGAIGQSLYGGIKSYGFRVVWHDLEPNHRLPLLPRARNCTLIAQYWLVPGTDLSIIYISRIACFTMELK